MSTIFSAIPEIRLTPPGASDNDVAMRSTTWQCATELGGRFGRLARPSTVMDVAAHVAGRSFGIHKYNVRPWGSGGDAAG
jgi:hypothetical protein